VITCECDETEMLEAESEFEEAWEFFKELGWRASKESGVWQHFCPDCVQKWREEQGF
jgi:hypothetical protein